MGLYGDFSDRYLEHENRNENKSKRLTLPPCFIRIERAELKLARIALKWPEMLGSYHE